MKLTMPAILYRLKKKVAFQSLANTIHADDVFEGLKSFDAASAMVDTNYLYLLSAQDCRDIMDHLPLNGCYICITNETDLQLNFPKGYRYVLLQTDRSKEALLNLFIDVFHEYQLWDQECHIAILKNKSLQEFIDLCEPMIEHPFILFGPGLNVLAYTRHLTTNHPGYNATIKNHFSHPDTLKKTHSEHIFQQVKNADHTIIKPFTTDHPFYTLHGKYVHKDQIMFCWGVFEYPAEDYSDYLSVMKLICENIFLHFHHAYNGTQAHEFYNGFINTLLERPDMSEEEITETIKRYPTLSNHGKHTLGQLQIASTARMPLSHYGYMLKSNLSHQFYIYLDRLYLLKTVVSGEKQDPFFTVKEQAVFQDIMKNTDYHLGISDTFFHIRDLPTAQKQCNMIIQHLTANPDTTRVAHFDEILLDYLLSNMDKTERHFLHSAGNYQLLKNYDATHPKDKLCDIYSSYIKHHNSAGQTASALGLHRNTVMNKINRISDLTQSNPDDLSFQLRFLLAEHLS